MVDSGHQSLEDQIDRMLKTFATWITGLIPFSWIQNGLAWYVLILETLKWMRTQTTTTVHAIRQSFRKPDILFFEYGGLYVPVLQYDTSPTLLIGRPSWAYSVETQSFHNVHAIGNVTTKTFSVPFIGAMLHYRSNTASWDEDITDWMSNQRIISTSEEMPLQVLVLKWAIDTGNSIVYTFEGYTLTLVTLEGEEMTCDVSTEEIIPPSTTGPAESDTKVDEDQEVVVEEEEEEDEEWCEEHEQVMRKDGNKCGGCLDEDEKEAVEENHDSTQNVPTQEESSESVQDA
jgi:hypothetical protein